jgi:cytochrome d ubiquinol oxidase subunit II
MFPAIGAVAATVLALSILRHNDRWPFYTVAVIFVSAFGTLALSIPVDEAAAPPSSLMFTFWGGVVVFSRGPKIRLPDLNSNLIL